MKTTEYCKTNPAKSSLGIAKAPRRSSKVKVMPIPSMVMVMPITVHLGCTQLNELGRSSPTRHPSATHTGKAVDTASPTTSIQLFFSAPNVFDELPHRIGFNPGLEPRRAGGGAAKMGSRK